MQVLIVEDDSGIAGNLTDYLQGRGYRTDWAANAAQALDRLESQDFDIMILDLGLPRVDGLRLLELLRGDWSRQLPVLVLTARDAEADKLAGFAAGADDYVVKPFSLAEVDARLQALLRRRQQAPAPLLSLGGVVELDLHRQTLTVEGELRRTQPKVIKLLALLMKQPGRVFSHAELEQAVWGEVQTSGDNLRQLLYQARKAIQLADGRQPLQTKHGLGYFLEIAS